TARPARCSRSVGGPPRRPRARSGSTWRANLPATHRGTPNPASGGRALASAREPARSVRAGEGELAVRPADERRRVVLVAHLQAHDDQRHRRRRRGERPHAETHAEAFWLDGAEGQRGVLVAELHLAIALEVSERLAS